QRAPPRGRVRAPGGRPRRDHAPAAARRDGRAPLRRASRAHRGGRQRRRPGGGAGGARRARGLVARAPRPAARAGEKRLAGGRGDPGALAGLGIVVGAAALAAWGWRRERPVCLALALAALPYSIVSNVFVTIGTVMAERLLYLPSAGFCLLVASAADAFGRTS